MLHATYALRLGKDICYCEARKPTIRPGYRQMHQCDPGVMQIAHLRAEVQLLAATNAKAEPLATLPEGRTASHMPEHQKALSLLKVTHLSQLEWLVTEAQTVQYPQALCLGSGSGTGI